MSYNFKEKYLQQDFAREKYREIKKLIDLTGAFTVIGMPAVGVSLFLKYLATRDFTHCIYLDLYSLGDTTVHELYLLLAKELGGKVKPRYTEQELLAICKKRLEYLVKKYKHIVVIVNRFEELESVFSKKFFGQLRVLRHTFNNTVTLIFSVTKPYDEMQPDAITGGNLYFYTKYYYFKPFKSTDLSELLTLHSPELAPTSQQLDKIIDLSGGHFQLTQLLLKTERGKVSPLKDPFIKLLLKQLYDNVSHEQKKQIQKLALRKATEVDEYLLDIGLVKPNNELFSSLFSQYVLSQVSLKMPSKEALLFVLLKKAKGKIVTKDTIFKTVWKNDFDGATDWALDSLIYRLRKNAVFKNSGYQLESYKKQGYALVKTS